MKTHRLFTASLALGALTIGTSPVALATEGSPHSFSANIGAVSNYLFRGVTQTQDGPAIQGGLDYEHESGFYAGTWASNVDFGDTEELIIDFQNQTFSTETTSSPNYELDAYLGYGAALTDDLSLDLKAMYYAYPDGRDLDLAEIDASATWKFATLGLAYTFYGESDDVPYAEGDLYYYASLDFALPFELGLSLRGGYYDFEYNAGGNDYGHGGVSISREAGDFGTFSFNYDQIGRDTYDDEPKVWVGWLKEF